MPCGIDYKHIAKSRELNALVVKLARAVPGIILAY